MSGPVPPPAACPLGRAAGVLRLLCPGCGRCGRGDPAPAPRRAPLRAGAARREGGGRASLGGVQSAVVWGVWGRALPPPLVLWAPRPLVRSGVRPGPTTHWLWVRAVRAWGPVTNPSARALVSWLCALWGRHEGARGGRLLPGCGASGVKRSPTPDHSSVRACGRGPLPTSCGCGGCGHGDTSPTPQRALLRAGFARCGSGTRAPGGGAPYAWVWGVRGRALSHPRPLVRSGVRPAPTTHWLWVRGVRAWGPITNPTARALACCGGCMRVPGGGASCLGVGRPGSGALPPQPLVLSGVRPGPTTHWLWLPGLGAWGPITNPSARALASWLCALWGRHEGARGGACCLGVGRPGTGALPPPTTRPFGRAAGPAFHWPWVRCAAWGPRCPSHLVPCRGSSCVVRASRVRDTRWPLRLSTCPRAVVVAGDPPLWRASWPRVGAPLLVRSVRSRCSGRLSRRGGAFPHPGGCRPRLYWVAARGTWRPAKNQAHCASRWPLPRQGRWARSASFLSGAQRWGCPWRVPPASVLGCVRCRGLRVWTRSLTRPVSRTVCLATGDSAGALGLFRVDADTAPFGSEDATPGSRACVP